MDQQNTTSQSSESSEGQGPVGQGDYEVKQGECIESIAFEHGLFWETVWNDSQNAELKQKRKDPNVLLPGDKVFVPEKEEKTENGATEEKHRFRLKGVPAKLRLRFLKSVEEEPTDHETPAEDKESLHATISDPNPKPRPLDEPRANVPYIIEIDGKLIDGSTDTEGRLEVSIPPNAKEGKVILERGTDRETVYPLKLGGLNPVSEISGVKERLRNLGHVCEDDSDEKTAQLEEAIRAFQAAHDLPITGSADQATIDKLKEVHGS